MFFTCLLPDNLSHSQCLLNDWVLRFNKGSKVLQTFLTKNVVLVNYFLLIHDLLIETYVDKPNPHVKFNHFTQLFPYFIRLHTKI